MCGPQVWLENICGGRVETHALERDCLDTASRLLREGYILALMGLGGVHLACDASNEAAVAELRRRKHRYQKPLALMARDVAVIRRYCKVSEVEAALLQSKHAPVVLLERLDKAGGEISAMPTFGFMLPYTPLHALLLETWETPLVMTSANLSEEPQCMTVMETRQRMQGIADYLLLHNLPAVAQSPHYQPCG